MISEKNELFSAKLEQEKEGFAKDLIRYNSDFEKIKQFKDLSQQEEFGITSITLRNNLQKAADQVRKFNERETIFGLPETPYPDLIDLDKAFTPFCELIDMSKDVVSNLKDWTQEKLMGKSYDEIASAVDDWLKRSTKLNKNLSEDYPDTAEVCVQLRAKIQEFSKNLPLIECFTADAITDEDWLEIKIAVGKQDQPFERDDIKVAEFGDLYDFIEEVEEITNKARKRYTLAQKLKLMKEEMKVFQLMQADYKGITFVIKGYDDINAKLDDQIVNTQEMLGSSFMKGRLKVDTRVWEQKLNHMSELTDQMLKVQKTWMYLEPIFSSGDIMNTMPLEGKMFNEVDLLWKTTMKGVEEEPCIIDLAEKENIMQQFVEANKKLDKIQKSLSDYLEQKRLVFARFFFLANEDLLQILA
jgi:dynein heavy chain